MVTARLKKTCADCVYSGVDFFGNPAEKCAVRRYCAGYCKNFKAKTPAEQLKELPPAPDFGGFGNPIAGASIRG